MKHVLCNVLNSKCLTLPRTKVEWEKIADDFMKRWEMPNCIGALDGKHIIMQAVANAGSTYYNYKGEHSIVLMAFVDAHRRFLYVDIGCNGRVSDGGVWDGTSLSQYLKDRNNPLNIPPPKELPGRSIKTSIFYRSRCSFSSKKLLNASLPCKKSY